MPQKATTLCMQIDSGVKERAEAILAELGIPASIAISVFYRQVIMRHGLTFEVTVPKHSQPDSTQMSREELLDALEESYADIEEGRA